MTRARAGDLVTVNQGDQTRGATAGDPARRDQGQPGGDQVARVTRRPDQGDQGASDQPGNQGQPVTG